MQQSYELSRVAISFGEDFEQGPTSVKLKMNINTKKAQDQYQYLRSKAGDKIDVDWSIVCVQKYAKGQKDAMLAVCNKIISNQRIQQYKKKLFADDEKVYFSIQVFPDEETQNTIEGQLQMFRDAGLDTILNDQDNQCKLNLDTNYDCDKIAQDINNGISFQASILKQIKLEFLMQIDNNFVSEIEKLIKEINPEMLESPQVAFLQMYKNVDVEWAFRSTDELPHSIQQSLMQGEESTIKNLNPTERQLDSKTVKGLVEAAESSGVLYFTIDEVLAVEIQYTVPNVYSLILNYGRYFAKLFGLNEFLPKNE
ncbi:hypothetical protein pb186bvf_017519 [Paramecium bursaria]